MINFSTLIISTILIYTHMMTQNEINVLFLFPFSFLLTWTLSKSCANPRDLCDALGYLLCAPMCTKSTMQYFFTYSRYLFTASK